MYNSPFQAFPLGFPLISASLPKANKLNKAYNAMTM